MHIISGLCPLLDAFSFKMTVRPQIWHWRQDDRIKNFGDYLAAYLTEKIFEPISWHDGTVHVIGSVIADFLVPESDFDAEGRRIPNVVFWGCGARDEDGLSDDRIARSEILAVRGPLTASVLKLGAVKPQGDIALFLPAVYEPRQSATTTGKTVCIPHFWDNRPDTYFTETGCDVVLRTNIAEGRAEILGLIDAIASADFVLTASLHGAIVAAAYGRPFAFWDNGHVDLPFKWQDLAAFLSIPSRFAASLAEAKALYAAEIAPSLSIPSLWAFLACAPFPIRPEALVKIAAHEVERGPHNSASHTFREMLDAFSRHRPDHRAAAVAMMARYTLTRADESRYKTELAALEAVAASHAEAATQAEAGRQQALLELANFAEAATLAETERQQALLELANFAEAAARAETERQLALHDHAKLVDDLIVEHNRTQALEDGRSRLESSLAEATDRLEQLSIEKRERERVLLDNLAEQDRRLKEAFEAQAATQLQVGDALLARDKAQLRYEKIASSRTWLWVRRSRKFREYFAAHRMQQRARRVGRILTGKRKRKPRHKAPPTTAASAHRATYLLPGVKTATSILIVDLAGRPLSDAARQQVQEWRGEGLEVVVCGQIDRWSRIDVGLAPADEGDIVDVVNARILASASTLTLLIADPETRVSGVSTADRAFAAFGSAAASCAVVLQPNGQIAAHGGDIADDLARPARPGVDPRAADVSYTQRCNLLWPAASVVDNDTFRHLGGLPSARDLTSAIIAYGVQARSRGLDTIVDPFLQASCSKPCQPIRLSLEHTEQARRLSASKRPQVLFTDATTPTPDRDSGSIDIYWFMHIFQDLGYDVTFMPLIERHHAGVYTDALRADGIRCILDSDVAEPWMYLRDMGPSFDLVLVYRVSAACHIIDPVREFAPQAKVVFDTVDLHFLREERAAALSGVAGDRDQAERTRVEELKVMAKSDATILLSSMEFDHIGTIAPEVKRHLISLVRPIPGRETPLNGRRDAMFVGGFKHRPNIDAALFLCRDVWPKVRELNPNLVVHIIGADVPAEIQALHAPRQGVNVVGFVDDLGPYYRDMRINLAPLRFGAGVKGKVAASLAAGLPTVGTDVAVEGMWLSHGIDVMVAHDPASFAEAVVQLSSDDELWERLSQNGVDVARTHFSIEAARSRLSTMLGELGLPNG